MSVAAWLVLRLGLLLRSAQPARHYGAHGAYSSAQPAAAVMISKMLCIDSIQTRLKLDLRLLWHSSVSHCKVILVFPSFGWTRSAWRQPRHRFHTRHKRLCPATASGSLLSEHRRCSKVAFTFSQKMYTSTRLSNESPPEQTGFVLLNLRFSSVSN